MRGKDDEKNDDKDSEEKKKEREGDTNSVETKIPIAETPEESLSKSLQWS